jgi:hypothetical protein
MAIAFEVSPRTRLPASVAELAEVSPRSQC